MDGSAWYLEGLSEDGRKIVRTAVSRFPFRLGRHGGCHLVLDSPLVSQRHAEIFHNENGLAIRDLGSTNGTFVNGRRVMDSHPLGSGDVLHLGDREFRLREEQTAEVLLDGKTLTLRSDDLQMGLDRSRQLQEMLRRRRVRARFQAIHRLDGSGILGFEALGRGVLGEDEIAPAELFAWASRLERDEELSRVLRENALKEAQGLPPGSVLFVNTHPTELEEPEELLSSLEAWQGPEGSRLVVEIHESIVADMDALRRLRRDLDALGVGLAFDDFGKGQARLLELTEASPHFLKFDAAWIHNLHRAVGSRREMLGALVRVVREMGIDAIAEGVEQEEQMKICRELGFQHAQGFYFGRPERLETLLAAG